MKKLILFFLILFNFIYMTGQEFCATPQTKPNETFVLPDLFDNDYCINVKFHIVRETNGTGGFDASQISNLTNLLNQFFNPHSINIINKGVDYVNNSALYIINDVGYDSTEFNQLISLNNDPNAINFYIVNSANYNGRAGDITSKNLVVTMNRALTSTSPHELGHCLNLYHTFQGTKSNTSGCAENIDGSNCTICGDYICDTPADADIGSINGYSPDLTNTMSYYLTRDHFTLQQGARMRNAIAGSPLLQSVRSNLCGGITGSPNLCYGISSSYTLSNPTNFPVSWSASPQQYVTLSNQTNTGVTVIPNNSTYNGIVTLSASYNSQTSKKDIWIGKPVFGVTQINNPNYYNESHFYIDVNTSLDKQGVSQIKWTKLSATKPGVRLYAGLNESEGFATGPDNSWEMEVKVEVTNSCGTTTQIVTITPPAFGGCTTYKLANNGKNNFQAIIIDPCSKTTNNSARVLNNEELNYSEVFDLRGNQIEKIYGNKFNFSNYNKGIYIIKLYIGNKIYSDKIKIE